MNELAVVVTAYRPNDQTRRLLERLVACGITPIVVDDGSPQAFEYPEGVEVICTPTNRGVGAALNTGIERARRRGATRVITFDQDSLPQPDYIDAIVQAWNDAQQIGLTPGVVAPQFTGDIVYRGRRAGVFQRVPEVMQSGALFELDQLAAIGDFDEDLVIDGVDTDACLKMIGQGFDVLTAPLEMEHRLGRARAVTVFGRRVLLTRHAAFRDYYMVRNRILLVRRHGPHQPAWALGMARRTLVAVLITLLFDDDRGAKAAAMARGLWDAIRNRSGMLPAAQRRRWQDTKLT